MAELLRADPGNTSRIAALTVPSTIVLDRRHRVAAIFLKAVRVSELLPVVQRVAAEPTGTDSAAGRSG